MAGSSIAVEFAEVCRALSIDDPPTEQKRKEIRRSRSNPLGRRLMCCQFPPDRMSGASYPVVGREGKLEPTRSGGRIRFFDAGQWELFHEDRGSTNARCLSCSPNTDAYFISIMDKHPYAGIVQPVEKRRDCVGIIYTDRHHYTLKPGASHALYTNARGSGID